jgi:hypothetical protein
LEGGRVFLPLTLGRRSRILMSYRVAEGGEVDCSLQLYERLWNTWCPSLSEAVVFYSVLISFLFLRVFNCDFLESFFGFVLHGFGCVSRCRVSGLHFLSQRWVSWACGSAKVVAEERESFLSGSYS